MEETADAECPTFRGCVFCYGAEWAYYGAKKVFGSTSAASE